MHEYIEVQFRRRDKPFRVKRQVSGGFEFEEIDPPTRAIELGFRAFDEITKYRMTHIRQVKGWKPEEFRLRVSVEDGALVIRGDDEYSLPQGFYNVTANVEGAKLKRLPKRIELKHDDHGVVIIDLELDERTVDVKLANADDGIRQVLEASTLDGEAGPEWVEFGDQTDEACMCVAPSCVSSRFSDCEDAAPCRRRASISLFGRTLVCASPAVVLGSCDSAGGGTRQGVSGRIPEGGHSQPVDSSHLGLRCEHQGCVWHERTSEF
jgi:hypothetical protein